MTGWFVRILVTLIGVTLRYRVDDPPGLLARPQSGPLIFAFWHNRIFLMPHLFRKYWRRRGRARVAVLVSRSKDGSLLAGVLAAFRLRCVRGSTSRGGTEALRELTRLVEAGYDVGITPDGPRGPRYAVQPGVVNLAQLTGVPIVPVSYDVSWKYTFHSWDAFQLPLPFGRCRVRVGVPLVVPRDADSALVEHKRLELERDLRSLAEPDVGGT
ncbi:lysophospholipid acyltransferase family protein [bacterium]|nr:lysophospholipid acyltransferase family protein [bacterium]